MSVRIEGVIIPNNKRVLISLRYVHGIGPKIAEDVLNACKIDFNVRVKDLSSDEISRLQKYITQNCKIEGDLHKEVIQNISRLKEIKCYRGSRHARSLPVRGQRTKTNARTRKGPGRAGKIKTMRKK